VWRYFLSWSRVCRVCVCACVMVRACVCVCGCACACVRYWSCVSLHGLTLRWLLRPANIANEVAKGEFSEATIGYKDKEVGAVWKKLFHSPTFRVRPPSRPPPHRSGPS
jgi:hypothetical protein